MNAPEALTNDVLRATLRDVERDEAEAIQTICQLLEHVEESRDFACLSDVRKVVKEWQHRPPRGIVTDLLRIDEKLKCRAHDKA